MASYQSKVFTKLLRLINKKGFLARQLKTGKFDRFDCPEPPRQLFGYIEKQQLFERNVFTLRRGEKGISDICILYLHGGAYVQSFNKAHWHFLSELVNETGCTVIAPDYPLAPAHTCKDAFAMVELLYEQLIRTVHPLRLVLMGDSAGGGLALALAQKMRDNNIAGPGKIILLSPWLDISLDNPDILTLEPEDPFLEKESLQQAGKLYAGGMSPANYLLSPVNGSLKGLGKMAVFAGSKEILVADTRKLKRKAKSEKIDLEYFEYPGMVHAWMFLNLPESIQARKRIVSLICQYGQV